MREKYNSPAFVRNKYDRDNEEYFKSERALRRATNRKTKKKRFKTSLEFRKEAKSICKELEVFNEKKDEDDDIVRTANGWYSKKEYVSYMYNGSKYPF